MLLDTHVLLWLLLDDPQLGAGARARLRDSAAAHVSVASLWEIAIKSERGRLTVSDDLPSQVETAGLEWLDVTPSHAWRIRGITGLPHPDPFDRMLVAQALDESVPLMTADRQILGSDIEGLSLVDARA